MSKTNPSRDARRRRLAATFATFTPLLAGTVLAAACTDAETPTTGEAAVVITDSAGITIVRFADLASLAVPERGLTVSAEVGGRAGSELYRVTSARLLEGGGLAIGNSGTAEVVYADDAGEVVGRAGGEGEGPGEFSEITGFPRLRGDTLTVYDVRLGRLTVLDPEGAVVETRPLEPPSRAVDLLPLAVADDGRVLAIHGDARIFGQSGVSQDTAPLMIVDPPSSIDTLSLWPSKQWSFSAMERGVFRAELGFGRSLEASGRNGRAVLGTTGSLALAVVDLDGAEVMRIEGTRSTPPVSADQVERWRAEALADLSDDAPAALRTAIENVPHNETVPAFSGVLLDADGRVWIGAWRESGAAERPWTVFGPDGEPAFRVTLPASATPLDAAGDRVVILDRTELAEEVVRVLTIS